MGWETKLKRKIMRINKSKAVIIPPKVIKNMNLKPGNIVGFKLGADGLMFLGGTPALIDRKAEYRKVTRVTRKSGSLKVTIPRKYAIHFRYSRHAEFSLTSIGWKIKPCEDS